MHPNLSCLRSFLYHYWCLLIFKMIRNCLVLCLTLLGLVACSPVKVMNTLLVPADGYTFKTDSYGPLPRQGVDVYIPHSTLQKADGLKPIVVFFYGGSWESGDRGNYKFVGEALTSQGIIAVVPDYRIYPEVKFPAFVRDGAMAVRWAKDHAQEWGGDPARIYLAGHSAGGHIAVMLSVDSEYLENVGMTPQELRGAIGLGGPYDFLPLQTAKLKAILGADDEVWKSQPVNFVDGKNPPLLLVTGNQDDIVDPGNASRMADRVHVKGGQATVKVYAGYNHIDVISKIAAPLRGDSDLLQTIAGFVQSH